MDWFARCICTRYQTTRIGVILWVIFDNFAIAYSVKYFIKIQLIIQRFFLCMIGDVVALEIYGSSDILNIHLIRDLNVVYL